MMLKVILLGAITFEAMTDESNSEKSASATSCSESESETTQEDGEMTVDELRCFPS